MCLLAQLILPQEKYEWFLDLQRNGTAKNSGFTLRYDLMGIRDITAVQLCETENFECKLLDRSHGAVWSSTCGIDGIDS
ncbi:hypothetical protein HN51_006889 [Arachis hypogaea]